MYDTPTGGLCHSRFGTRSLTEAEAYARRLLTALAEEAGARDVGAGVGLGTVFRLYVEHRAPYLSEEWHALRVAHSWHTR